MHFFRLKSAQRVAGRDMNQVSLVFCKIVLFLKSSTKTRTQLLPFSLFQCFFRQSPTTTASPVYFPRISNGPHSSENGQNLTILNRSIHTRSSFFQLIECIDCIATASLVKLLSLWFSGGKLPKPQGKDYSLKICESIFKKGILILVCKSACMSKQKYILHATTCNCKYNA